MNQFNLHLQMMEKDLCQQGIHTSKNILHTIFDISFVMDF